MNMINYVVLQKFMTIIVIESVVLYLVRLVKKEAGHNGVYNNKPSSAINEGLLLI